MKRDSLELFVKKSTQGLFFLLDRFLIISTYLDLDFD